MKIFSTFSGVEGFCQKFEDIELVGFSEVDKYASMVLKYHYPEVKNYGDITKINWGEIPDFEMLVGGSPCQDFSIAGKRKGITGERSGLVWEFIRCLEEKKPQYFIWENVKGVMSSRRGFDFANILTAFSESGYSLWWQVLNAKDFGVPQNRERVFVCGFREGSPTEILFEPKDSGQIEIVGTTKGNRVYGTDGLSTTLSSQGGGMGAKTGLYIVASRGRGENNEQKAEAREDGITNTLTGVEKDNYVVVSVALRNKNRSKHQNKKGLKYGDFEKEYEYEENKEGVSFAVKSATQEFSIREGQQVRKLMPIECERLMGWADDWTRWGIDEKGNKVEISDSQRYKMCGNGVVANVSQAIYETLFI